MFVRNDSVRRPLQPPYSGPYKVLDTAAKHFTVDRDGHTDTVARDEVVPENPQLLPQPTTPSPVADTYRTTHSVEYYTFPMVS